MPDNTRVGDLRLSTRMKFLQLITGVPQPPTPGSLSLGPRAPAVVFGPERPLRALASVYITSHKWTLIAR